MVPVLVGVVLREFFDSRLWRGFENLYCIVKEPISEKAGDCTGRYMLRQQIGEGVCGVVYMAEQEEPVRRRVALKVVKLGVDTKSVYPPQ
jgi:hypothetical protein